MAKERKLTPRQQRFVEEYILDLNATAAAVRSGYSKKTADRIGPELLGKTCVAVAVEKAKAMRSERTEITADWVLEQYAAVWNAKITDVLTQNDQDEFELRRLEEWPEIWHKMTTPGEMKRLKARSRDGKEASWDDIGQQIKMNIFPKSEALKKIGEHVLVKAFPQRGDVNLTLNIDGIREELAAARERARMPERIN